MANFLGSAGADLLIGTSFSDVLFGMEGNDSLFGLGGNDFLDGGAGADFMGGGTGDDIYVVDNALDNVVELSNEGSDLVAATISYTLGANVEKLTLKGVANLNATGNALNNTLQGNDGNNVLDGKAGGDYMNGGKGNDTYYVNDANDVADDYATGFTGIDGVNDVVMSTVDFTEDMSNNGIETIMLLGNANLKIIGRDIAQTLIGNTGNNWLDGGANSDVMKGGLGDDIYIVDYTKALQSFNPWDTVVENAGAGSDTIFLIAPGIGFDQTYTLADNVETIFVLGIGGAVVGNAQNNLLLGSAFDDALYGMGGADTLKGGLGNDSYGVDNMFDIVGENAAAGTDTVYATVNYVLTSNVENLVLSAPGFQNNFNINGTGNTLDNNITGSNGNNKLDGGVGADKMTGYQGDDTFVVDSAGDVVVESANQGSDWVQAWGDYTLGANVENLQMFAAFPSLGLGNALNNIILGNSGVNAMLGNAGDDTLDSGAGNDQLYGGAGIDIMKGGIGDDVYGADDIGDTIIEDAVAGTDTVNATIDWSLGLNLENLWLLGNANLKGIGNGGNNDIQGNSGNNVLMGGLGDDNLKGTEGADTLDGGAGNDLLDGGIGIDAMTGGLGDDLYWVYDSGDTIIEDALGGADTVNATIDWSLGLNFENLILLGNANLNGIGNVVNNDLQGNSGNNILIGDLGADTLEGGAGDDQLQGGLDTDMMTGGIGDDSYEVSQSTDITIEDILGGTDTVLASITWDLGANMENLVLQGSADINARGNELDNNLQGNTGNNVLRGYAGIDSLTGGVGADIFVFDTDLGGGDVVKDFVAGSDLIRVKDAAIDLNIGNGDHLINNPILTNSPVVFSNQAELVVITPDILGSIDTTSAASTIGSAASAYSMDDIRVFAVDNGVDSAVFLFHSANADAQVSANELTLLGTLQGVALTALSDYVFG